MRNLSHCCRHKLNKSKLHFDEISSFIAQATDSPGDLWPPKEGKKRKKEGKGGYHNQ
jgi:hypothetical protein